jgi:hypothetical protein
MIPTYLEQLIHEGKAEYKSISVACSPTSIIPCPTDCYIVAYEYWYRMPVPWNTNDNGLGTRAINLQDLSNYVSFFSGSHFYPFFHQMELDQHNITALYSGIDEDPSVTLAGTRAIDNVKTQYRQMYIVSNIDISVIMSRSINADMGFESNVMPGYKNFVPGIGYGGLNIETNFERFNENNALAYSSPFTPDYYRQIGYAVDPSYNQFFFNAPAGGQMETPSNYMGGGGGTSSFAGAKSRALYFHCNYVQVNQQLPKKLKG